MKATLLMTMLLCFAQSNAMLTKNVREISNLKNFSFGRLFANTIPSQNHNEGKESVTVELGEKTIAALQNLKIDATITLNSKYDPVIWQNACVKQAIALALGHSRLVPSDEFNTQIHPLFCADLNNKRTTRVLLQPIKDNLNGKK